MADALCGPSNALQNFQKHTTVDRTLQQDRIASRQNFGQGFRSTPGQNAGILDAEFEAFQAGEPINGLYVPQQFAPGPLQDYHAVGRVNPAAPSWAADFQSMQYHQASASPTPQSQFRREAPIQHTVPGGWHQDFMGVHITHPSKQNILQPRYNAGKRYIEISRYKDLREVSMLPTIAQQKQPESQQIVDSLDQEAMERAFDAVSIEQNEALNGMPAPVDMAKDLEEMYPFEETRIGSDRILDESTGDEAEKDDKHDADELARTAGQLLDNVKHDQSEKFQKSSFFSLMRQLRDREVQVEGDKLVDVSLSQSHS